jgi:aryl-alcohol dehydrogenase-like predicted oxidoreductase
MQRQLDLGTTTLGVTGLRISRIGIGTWAMGGGDWKFGWGPQDDDDSIAAVQAALDLGVNWIDTAAVYGLGHAEEVIGRALDGLSARPYLFTKTGRVEAGHGVITGDLTRDSIRREIEASLSRLRTDAVDLYQLHWPDPPEQIEEGWAALAELKAEGLVRHIGVCNFDARQLRVAESIAPVESLQSPYSLIDRDIEAETLPYARDRGMGVLAYAPMGSGLLTGAMTAERIRELPSNDWRSQDPRFQDPENLRAADRVRAIADEAGVAPGAIAVAWVLHNPAVTAAIAGFRRADQVGPILAGARLRLSDGDTGRLEPRSV